MAKRKWNAEQAKAAITEMGELLLDPKYPHIARYMRELEEDLIACKRKCASALHQAVASQYFGETHKHRAHLYDIMETLDPRIAKVFDVKPERAFRLTERSL